jgi:hypothetical protein
VSENLNAQILAQWLEGAPDGTVPESLDPEVVETIFALRPEYAPAPSVTIEAVLASLSDGPLVDPAIGEALRRWLEAGPGTAPPDLLPIGIVEAFYALRPEMAPAPSLGIEDILNSVTEGPFAAEPQTAELIELAPPSHRAASPLPSETHPPETPRSWARRRWWTGPSLTVAAVAATTLFFVGRMPDRASESNPSIVGSYVPAAPSAAADALQLHTVTFENAKKEMEVSPVVAALEPPEASPSARPLPTSRTTARRRPSREATELAPQARGSSSEVKGQLQAQSMPPVGALDEIDGFGSADGPAMAIGSILTEATSGGSGTPMGGRERKKSRRKAARWYQSATGGGGGGATDRAGSAEAPSPSKTMTEDDLEMEADEMEPEERPDEDIAQAAPPQSAPPPTRGRPQFHEAEAQTRSLFAAGENEKALKQVEAALKLKSNSPFTKARLLRLKADILVRLGRETDAQQARAEAARMDPTR